MKELIIKTQKEFDKIKDSFEGKIIIQDTKELLSVNRSFNNAYIVVSDNATIKYVSDNATIKYVYGNATIKSVYGNATIKSVSDNATIKSVSDNATIKSVSDNATIEYVYGNATIESVYGNATIKYVSDNATIKYVSDNATIKYVYGNATIKSVYGNATIEYVYGNATIKYVSDNATIKSVSDNATILLMTGMAIICFLYGAKKIVARGVNTIRQIGDKKIDITKSKETTLIKIKELDIYINPTIDVYQKLYPVKQTGIKLVMYKAVRKINNEYVSNYNNNFKYEIGKVKEEVCSKDKNNSCNNGIHISHLDWARRFGRDWENLAILEVEVNKKDIVVSKDCDGKVRASKIKVIRELDKSEY